jgi:hypothetical protein
MIDYERGLHVVIEQLAKGPPPFPVEHGFGAGAAYRVLVGRAVGILIADGQLAGTPSVLFDAVAVILSDEGAKALSKEGAAIDFVRDAFGHLKAIAADKGGMALLKLANAAADAGVVDSKDGGAFIAAAKTRQWDREKSVRTLA